MKKIILLASLLCAILSVDAQTKYYRVQVFTDDAGLKQLAKKGVAVDHGAYQRGKYFIGEFSEHEFDLIKQSHYPFQILISDMSAYYVARSKTDTFAIEEPVTSCKYTKPQNFKLGSMGGFYTYAEMLQILDSMRKKFPNLITKKKPMSATLTADGNVMYWVRISNNPKVEQNKPKILYTALHHAREPESLTQLIFFMWYLLENYNTNTDIKNIIDNEELYFVPCVNPDGYLYNQFTNPGGGGMWRKNRRNNGDGNYGVDLNRNYGYKWGYDDVGSSNYTGDETYRGPYSFSEPETQIIGSFCQAHHFNLALNHHTYNNVLVFPYGYKENTYTPDSATFLQYAQDLTLCNGFFYGTVNQTLGYLANGDSDDWMYGEQTLKPKIFAMTPETGSSTDGFWPPSSRIVPLAKKNMQMNITAAQLAAGLITPIAKTNTVVNANFVTMLTAAPNPCAGNTIITYQLTEAKGSVRIIVSNAYGKLIQSVTLHSTSGSIALNTSNLPGGTYYYSIVSDNCKSKVQKLVVIK
jgi:hypothetical protein